MIAVAGASLLFGIKVALHCKETGEANRKNRQAADSCGAERRASQWLSSQAAHSVNTTSPASSAALPAHSFSQHACVDEGYIVCFANSAGEVLCVHNVGSRQEMCWHALKAPPAGAEGRGGGGCGNGACQLVASARSTRWCTAAPGFIFTLP